MKIIFEVPYEKKLMIDVEAILLNNNVGIDINTTKITLIIEDGIK